MKEQNEELKNLCLELKGDLSFLIEKLEKVESGKHGWKKAAYSARMLTLELRNKLKYFRRLSTKVSEETILPHYKPGISELINKDA